MRFFLIFQKNLVNTIFSLFYKGENRVKQNFQYIFADFRTALTKFFLVNTVFLWTLKPRYPNGKCSLFILLFRFFCAKKMKIIHPNLVSSGKVYSIILTPLLCVKNNKSQSQWQPRRTEATKHHMQQTQFSIMEAQSQVPLTRECSNWQGNFL